MGTSTSKHSQSKLDGAVLRHKEQFSSDSSVAASSNSSNAMPSPVPAERDVPWHHVKSLASESHFCTSDVLDLQKKFSALAVESPDPNALQEDQFRDALAAAGFDFVFLASLIHFALSFQNGSVIWLVYLACAGLTAP